MTLDSEDIQCIYWARRLVAEPQKALEDIIELRNICVLMANILDFTNDDATTDEMYAAWEKAREVLKRTDPEKNQ